MILLSCPHTPSVGEELPRKCGLGQVLAFLTFRDSCRKKGTECSLPQSFLLNPSLNFQGPWLASLAGSHGPERWGKEASGLLAVEAQIWAGWAFPSYSSLEDFSSLPWPSLLPAAKWTGTTKPQDLLYLQDLV